MSAEVKETQSLWSQKYMKTSSLSSMAFNVIESKMIRSWIKYKRRRWEVPEAVRTVAPQGGQCPNPQNLGARPLTQQRGLHWCDLEMRRLSCTIHLSSTGSQESLRGKREGGESEWQRSGLIGRNQSDATFSWISKNNNNHVRFTNQGDLRTKQVQWHAITVQRAYLQTPNCAWKD